MTKTYTDHIMLIAAAQELLAIYGRSTVARLRRCEAVLRQRSQADFAAVCRELVNLVEAMAFD